MASDYVVVFAFDEEPVRAMRLVAAVSRRGFTVIANEAAGGVAEVYDFLYDAAAVVAAWGHSTSEDRLWHRGLGRIVPVKLTPAAQLPDEFAQLESIDLGDWVEDGPAFAELIRRLTALVEDSRRQPSSFDPTLAGWAGMSLEAFGMSAPLNAVGELQRLASEVHGVAMLLADDADHTRQMRATLKEIGNSYRVVLDAVDAFYEAGADPDHMDVATIARIRGGRLAERIHNGRGHCKRIGARYFSYEGLRNALKVRVPADTLEQADSTFAALTTADTDLFNALDGAGTALTLQAREIYSLMIGGQQQEARRQFDQARGVLAPLENALHDALHEFLDAEQLLGYAQESPAEAPHVEDRSMHFYGPVTNSVVANTIKGSYVVLQSAQLPSELKENMEQLLKAVGAMSEKLSAEDAEAAASELDQLTKEVAGEQPRKGIIRKCLRSLEQFGKRVADVGLPVVELTAKISALF